MTDAQLAEVAELLRERNLIDERLAQVLGRPPEKGHTSEWIASRIFDIALETSASHKAIDGRFRSGPLAGRTVNVKWMLKREGGLDMTESADLDYYLVLTGPTATAMKLGWRHAPLAHHRGLPVRSPCPTGRTAESQREDRRLFQRH